MSARSQTAAHEQRVANNRQRQRQQQQRGAARCQLNRYCCTSRSGQGERVLCLVVAPLQSRGWMMTIRCRRRRRID